ncbi:hypothetical protein MTX36_10480 [Rhodococcus sp. ARC_M6]|nr:hypothetical protein [Rhodococcus sp. ARC_M6]
MATTAVELVVDAVLVAGASFEASELQDVTRIATGINSVVNSRFMVEMVS